MSLPIETSRLRIRHFEISDAPFVQRLVSQPSYIKGIRDTGVRTLEGAAEFIAVKFIKSYEKNGFGFYLVELKNSGEPVGMSGLIKRPHMDDPDIGYALLSEFEGKGYALESTVAVKNYARDNLGWTRLSGIVRPENAASIRLLEKLGMTYQRNVIFPDDSSDNALYEMAL